MEFLAHKSEDGRTQTIKEHLENTAEISAKFGESFNAEDVAKLVGLTHDLGKYSEDFQMRINGKNLQVDHSTFGGYVCYENYKNIPAAFAVMGHHGGLPDGGGKGDTSDQGTFFGRCAKAKEIEQKIDLHWKQDLNLSSQKQMPGWINNRKDAMFYTRMIFSCLVDADYLDTEKFMNGSNIDLFSHKTLKELDATFNQYIQKWNNPRSKLDCEREKILNACIETGMSKTSQHLFTLTVPTGGGKTISSLAFALKHAIKNNYKRIIYVIPYTSIIEQTAQVFRKILGDNIVLEHHSNYQFDLKNDEELNENNLKYIRATENWDAPIIVTTAVQFFESLFSNKPSKCRKLHNICESVVIFDEAQMLPINYLYPCVWAISELIDHYNVSALLCTATQPALDNIFLKYTHQTKEEICPSNIDLDVFNRVSFQNIGQLSLNSLSEKLNEKEQVLCVVNARKSAQKIFEKLSGNNRYHLSTLMCPIHRREVLDVIREKLHNGESCRVVSTSLIEAGVDIDFPVVYREEAGLDSVLQAAGRCNREGKRNYKDSFVYIFRGEDLPPKIFETQISVGRDVLEHYPEKISSKEAIQNYFEKLFQFKGDDILDKTGIISLMEDETLLFPFNEITSRFHLVEKNTKSIYVPYNEEAKHLIAKLKNGFLSKIDYRKLEQYTVQVYEDMFKTLNNQGAISILEDGSAELLYIDKYYSKDVGLNINENQEDSYFI